MTWIFNNFVSEGRGNPILMCWIHSHVRGVECGFSAIDVHTQNTFAKIHHNVLGMVIQLNETGRLAKYDFYEMSRQGSRYVENCSRKENCNSMQQHESCYNANFYKTARDKVMLHDDSGLTVQNFMTPNTRVQNEQHENDIHLQQPCEFETHQPMETGDSSQNVYSKNSSSVYDISQFLVDASNLVRCKICRQKMMKEDIQNHLEKAPKCAKNHEENQQKAEKANDLNINQLSDSDESLEASNNNVPSDNDSDFEYLNEMPRKKRKIDGQHKNSTTKDRSQCKVCKKDYVSLIKHLGQKISCREMYGDEYEEMIKSRTASRKEYWKNYYETNKEQQRNYYRKNKTEIRKKQNNYKSQHQEELTEKHRKYNQVNQETIRVKKAERDEEKKAATTEKERFENFKNDIINGPNYICFSCHRQCFIKQVKILKPKELSKLFAKVDNDFLKHKVGIDTEATELTVCHNCHKLINSKKPQLPRIHWSNGLKLEEVPEELKLKDLEQQLIARVLLFQKIKKLPSVPRMKAGYDKIVCVPVESDIVSKTVSQLPRHPDDANIVAVKLKKKLEIKNTYLEEYIRPKFLVKALAKLKSLGNIFYQDITVDKNFMNKENNLDDIDDSEGTQEVQNVSENDKNDMPESSNFDKPIDSGIEVLETINENKINEPVDDNIETEDNEDRNDRILPNVKEFQADQDDLTCLLPEEMSHKVVVNNGKSDIIKDRGEGKDSVKIAPGENIVPSSLMREDYFDVKAFPKHHPSGRFGLHFNRIQKLSPQVYFNQRLLNADERFSRDPCYLFMASYYVERHALERYINISGRRGKSSFNENGERVLNLTDSFDVFKNLSGSPKYWQLARNELVAKVKQLGPFHIFYTFSCGEMRWAECFISLLIRKGHVVTIPPNWDGNENELLIEEDGKEGVPLWTYVNKVMTGSKHDLFKDYVFLTTRLFDARVKSFTKNILMGGGRKVKFKYYSYRVEFQARGYVILFML